MLSYCGLCRRERARNNESYRQSRDEREGRVGTMDVKLSVMLMTALYSGVFVAANDNMMIAQCSPRSSDGYQHHINIVSTDQITAV